MGRGDIVSALMAQGYGGYSPMNAFAQADPSDPNNMVRGNVGWRGGISGGAGADYEGPSSIADLGQPTLPSDIGFSNPGTASIAEPWRSGGSGRRGGGESTQVNTYTADLVPDYVPPPPSERLYLPPGYPTSPSQPPVQQLAGRGRARSPAGPTYAPPPPSLIDTFNPFTNSSAAQGLNNFFVGGPGIGFGSGVTGVAGTLGQGAGSFGSQFSADDDHNPAVRRARARGLNPYA